MVTFGLLRDLAQKELSEYLDKYAGTKVSPFKGALYVGVLRCYLKKNNSLPELFLRITD